MTGNLIPLYACAALTVTALGALAKQNRNSGWRRNRLNFPEAMEQLYSDLGLGAEEPAVIAGGEWKPVTPEEAIGFSAQMLKLRAVLGASTAITAASQKERELMLQ